jgi:DNA repair protein SbcD/Mre11
VTLRLLHTADWHLGHTLAGHARDAEHNHMLRHLVSVIEEQQPHALLLCGDVYDTGNPPAHAQAAFYSFLAAARRAAPTMRIVVIGGNHDAPGRIDAPAPLLAPMNVVTMGAMRQASDGRCDGPACLVPLHVGQAVAAVAVVLPFLRAVDLLPPQHHAPHSDLVQAAVADAYARASDAARSLYPGVPLVMLGHLHAQGGRLSATSERPLFGNQHAIALPSITGGASDVAYVALGHLHLAQALADERIRYSGSPIPLSMTERHYQHSVSIVDIDGHRAHHRTLALPRLVPMLRIPDDDPEPTIGSLPLFRAPAPPLDDVLDRLRALELADAPPDQRAFLEVRVSLQQPVPDLRARIELALADKPVRLTRIHKTSPAVESALADAVDAATGPAALEDLSPMSVFASLYARQYDVEPPAELLRAFRDLLADTKATPAEEL